MFYFSVLVSWAYLQGCEYVSGLYSGRNQTVFLTGKQTVCTHPDPHPTGAADIFFSLVLNAFLKVDLFFSTQCSPSNKETAYFHDTCHSVHLACCKQNSLESYCESHLLIHSSIQGTFQHTKAAGDQHSIFYLQGRCLVSQTCCQEDSQQHYKEVICHICHMVSILQMVTLKCLL